MLRFRNLTNRPPVLGALGAVVALVLAACAAGAGSGGSGEDLTLSVVDPADGAEVSQPFEIQVESNVPLGEPETGNHHVHFYYDTDITSADYQIVYGDSAEIDRELTPGEHTIIASLRNADHSDAGPAQEFTVNVTDGSGDSGDSGATESEAAPSDPGFVDY